MKKRFFSYLRGPWGYIAQIMHYTGLITNQIKLIYILIGFSSSFLLRFWHGVKANVFKMVYSKHLVLSSTSAA